MSELIHTADIAEQYLPALINGDYSGLEDHEAIALDRWAAEFQGCCFVSETEYSDFGRDEVSGLRANVVTVEIYR